ncbi:inner membrane protein YihY [Nonlabens ulvanivorans]|nr:YhjD/YihY/BrkB family envelope integrity protein [Nonlabens ulvanivorans]GAK88920.1 inner membrane protein YihY [Nonlabens ulvanivorans]
MANGMAWSLLTGVLFETGKFLLEIYFTQSSPASAYGAAGLIVLLLLWVSYSSLILFYGAEFIKIYASRYGNGISPPSSKSLKYREELIITDKGADVTEKEIEELIKSDDNPIVDR